ncbi:HpcH/HpaI aldolase family protein [Litoreibacter roseus]|uniref:4-hydroxy-2-oxovalerate aldolase n=1 Tax=Litoreibacter roseus TaxID=2601869 RepID=A0A6N6JDW8_9RHOB|nr:aldolase/citrate lyase family protein [Litoreibacter roseus]GFE63589.1 4-hydroxy-2-oxovalerate aldolase [Litoreibacter roseus]
MSFATLKARMVGGEKLVGSFLKTPAVELIEILSGSGLDFLCLDAEHAPFDRARLDTCLAIGRALDFPILVRVPAGTPEEILKVMDAGAVGIVVPHVDSVEKAQAVAKAARFGHGGRGFAGSTRWAGFATRTMGDILDQSATETLVIAQIEEPEGVDAIDGIAGTEGIDGVFIGPADLSVAYGKRDLSSDALKNAMKKVGEAARTAGVAYVTWVPDAKTAKDWSVHGFTTFVVASEHAWMLQGAKRVVSEMP